MAEKKKATKTKKLHPGGSVPGFRPIPRQLTPAQQRLQRRGTRRSKKQDMELAQAAGYKNMRQMQAAMERMTPEQRIAFQRKNSTKFREIFDRNRGEFEKRNAKLINRVRRQQQRRMRQQNPMMPTAGISQGRPIRGRTPMPGPAPDSEAMKRMQKLMREQQARFNAIQKARSMQNQGNSRMATAPVQMMNNLPAAVRRAIERGQGFTNQQLRDAISNSRKRRRPNRDIRNRNRTRATGLPDAKYS